MRKSETMRAASRLLLGHAIFCLLAVLAAVVVLGVLGPIKVVHATDVAPVEAENFFNKPTGTSVVTNATFYSPPNYQALRFNNNTAIAWEDVDFSSSTSSHDVVLMARASQSGGSPKLRVGVNGTFTAPAQAITNSGAPQPYTFDVNAPSGSVVRISVKAANTATGRKPFVDYVTFLGDGGTDPPPTTRPNILFVMTDDMPENLLNRMPEVDGRIVSEGINFPNAYVSQSLCCPSRASIFTGMYPHNTGIWSNSGAHGGAGAFRALGLEQRSVPIWLKGNGYTTGLVGKYLNEYDASYVPPGWSYWYGRGFGTGFANENGQISSYSGDVEDDTLTAKALGFLDRATDQAGDPPFALFVWTQSPHLRAEDYAPRYANLYNDEVFTPPPSFNEADVSDKPQWVRDLPRISAAEQAELSELHRNQLRSLKGVDDMVGAMLDLLQERSELENTYVVFTTDNGAHMGEHRWWLGRGGYKNTAYEEAAGVPLAIRGPGIPADQQVRPQLVLNNDFAPTFADIADAPVPEDVDGRSLLPLMNSTPPQSWRTAVLNEKPGGGGYHSLITNRYTYVEYKTGERELYDRQQDPYQLSSIHRTASPALLDSLHSRLALLKACAGQSCRTREDTP